MLYGSKTGPCPKKTFASLRLCVKRIRTMKHMKLHESGLLMLLAVPSLSRAPKNLCVSAPLLNESNMKHMNFMKSEAP